MMENELQSNNAVSGQTRYQGGFQGLAEGKAVKMAFIQGSYGE
jgi:hypothetical protein